MTNFRNRNYEWERSLRAKDVEDESEPPLDDVDDTEGTSSGGRRVKRRLRRLRESLTEGMAFRAFKCRKGRSPREGELDRFMEELITSAYNCGYDTWDDDFLYSD
jgi:hypothetical protein